MNELCLDCSQRAQSQTNALYALSLTGMVDRISELRNAALLDYWTVFFCTVWHSFDADSVFIVSDDLQGLDSVCCIVCHQRLPNLLLL